MLHFGIGYRTLETDIHWSEDFSSFLGRKSVICFPGRGTKNARSANGMCKIVAGILPPHIQDSIGDNIFCAYYKEDGGYDIGGFCCQYFLPLMIKPNVVIKSMEELSPIASLPHQEIKTNFRNIVFVTHCYGSLQVAELEKFLRQSLKRLGFSDEERQDILRQLFVLHFNDINHDFGKTKMTTLHLVSQYDTIAKEQSLMPYNSLKRYCFKNKLEGEEPILFYPGATEAVLLFNHVLANYGMDKELLSDDHKGAFWTKKRMNISSRKGYEVYSLLLGSVLKNKGALPDIKNLITAVSQEIKQEAFVQQSCAQGEKYIGQYNEEKTAYLQMRSAILSNIKQGTLVDVPPNGVMTTELWLEPLGVNDQNSLVDYALQKGDLKQIKVMLSEYPNLKMPMLYTAKETNNLKCLNFLSSYFDDIGKVLDLINRDINRLDEIVPLLPNMPLSKNPYNNYPQLIELIICSERVQDKQTKTYVRKELVKALFNDNAVASLKDMLRIKGYIEAKDTVVLDDLMQFCVNRIRNFTDEKQKSVVVDALIFEANGRYRDGR